VARLIYKDVLSVNIVITRRLIPIPGAPGPRAPGGVAFICAIHSSLEASGGYDLVEDDATRRPVQVGEIAYSDFLGHGLAYYLDVAGT